MAIRYAVATGNWSNTATWDGGTLPTSADDVYANNRTVTIDQNVTVLTLRTTAGGVAVAGGKFTMPSGNAFNVTATNGFIAGSGSALEILGTGTRIITGNSTGSSTTATVNTIYVQNVSGNIPVVTINGNLFGGSQSSATALYIWGGYVTVNGSVTGGTASTNAAAINIFNSDNQPTQLTVNNGPITGGSSGSGSTSAISVGYSPIGSALTNSYININCAINGGSLQGSNYGLSSSSTIPINIVGDCFGNTVASAINQTASVAGTILTINGNLNATNTTAVLASANTVNVTGTITGGAGTNTGGINYQGIGVCTITGDVYGSTSNINGRGVYTGFNTPGSMIVNGNVYARNGIGISQTGNGSITVNGNVFAGTATNSYGMSLTSSSSFTINGNVTGGSGGQAYGIFHNNTIGIVTVNGSAIAGTGSGSHGVFNNTTGTAIITKAVGNGYGIGSVGISSGTFGVLSNANNSVTRVKQIELGSLGAFPVGGAVTFIDDTTNQVMAPLSTGGTKTLVDPNATGLMPATSNVRLGTTYSFGNLTGTMAVPAANSVAAGVAVDNTVGTAVLTQANVWDYALSSASSVAGSVGEKLKKTAIPADIIALG